MRTALRNKTHVPRLAGWLLDMIANANLGMIYPHTIGTNESDVRLTRQRRDGLLEL